MGRRLAHAIGLTEGKRSALQHSVLRLNNTLTAYDSWSEQDVDQRGRELAERANRIWARPAPSPAAAAAAVEPEPADPEPVQPQLDEHKGKYAALFAWLKAQEAPEFSTTFGAIEDVLGFSLPPSSRDHLPHWYGYDGSAVARAVIDAGWRASNVNLTAGTVTFIRSD